MVVRCISQLGGLAPVNLSVCMVFQKLTMVNTEPLQGGTSFGLVRHPNLRPHRVLQDQLEHACHVRSYNHFFKVQVEAVFAEVLV